MKTSAIIPIKSFSRAKTRLELDTEKTEIFCHVMLEEVLDAVSKSKHIQKMRVKLPILPKNYHYQCQKSL